MQRFISGIALACLLALPLQAQDKPVSPNDVVAAAPAADWMRIAPADLMVMDLAPDAQGQPRRVVIQLMPAPFSQGWVENIRKLVSAHWFDGIAVVRTQDNYVVQWGDPDGETPGKAKPLPQGLRTMTAEDYTAMVDPSKLTGARAFTPLAGGDAYAPKAGFLQGWPVGLSGKIAQRGGAMRAWPVHCYGMVGVGRNLSPDTGTGAELYTVIGQAPRQLDRNIALVGRIIAGMEHLSSLPRGTGQLGFYEKPEQRTPIVAVRMGDQVADLPGYEYLSTTSASFAAYVDKRANRKDDFYALPAGGVDLCNAPVPVREMKP